MDFIRLLYTAKSINLSVDEFWEMSPYTFVMLIGYTLEANGRENPFRLQYIDE